MLAPVQPRPAAHPVRRPAGAASPAADAALEAQQQAFDLNLRLRAEAERESNALRALFEEQRKRDDEYLRKVIELI